MSKNVYKATLDQIVGQRGNKEFTDLINILGCNVGSKFDLSKLQFNKIIIASDADVDGLFIRSLLMAFFFKLFPEIIKDNRLYIAEPPLYRVGDRKDPFVINKEDYINRYSRAVTKDYRIGFIFDDNSVSYFKLSDIRDFLQLTYQYPNDMQIIAEHYKINERLLEIIFEKFSMFDSFRDFLNDLNIQDLLNRINQEFSELTYDYDKNLIIGSIDAKMQLIEINETLFNKSTEFKDIILTFGSNDKRKLLLKDNKNNTEHDYSMLQLLKILKKYQPEILHRFKGLGENSDEDIKLTIMDPNTRSLIKVNIGDIENDMKIFQMLRGSNYEDLEGRRMLMKNMKIDRALIDT